MLKKKKKKIRKEKTYIIMESHIVPTCKRFMLFPMNSHVRLRCGNIKF